MESSEREEGRLWFGGEAGQMIPALQNIVGRQLLDDVTAKRA